MIAPNGLLARTDKGPINAVLTHASCSVAAAVPEGLREQTAWLYSDAVTAMYSAENRTRFCKELTSTDPVTKLATDSAAALMMTVLRDSPVALSVARYAAQMLLLEWFNARGEIRQDEDIDSHLVNASEALDLKIIGLYGITPAQVVHYSEPPARPGAAWH